MPIESVTHVADLVPTNPEGSDNVQLGADHLRLIKSALKTTFPAATAPYTVTPAISNALPGRVTAVETNRARKDIADSFAALMTFTTGLNAASVKRATHELNPIGSISMWLTNTPPAGHVFLSGQELSRTTYAALYALWGPSGSNVVGPGDGSTTFTMPTGINRFPVGAGGGVPLGTTGGSATPTVEVSTVAAHTHTASTTTAGAHDHGGSTGGTALTVANLPPHSHPVTDPGHAHEYLDRVNTGTAEGGVNGPNSGGSDIVRATSGAPTGITIGDTGSGTLHFHSLVTHAGHTHPVTVNSAGGHTHTATIEDGRPPFMGFHYIVRAL